MVSIIIPNYNHALFLKKRIDSVLNQTFKNFELILMDDCSTDHSQEIMKEYRSHPQITQLIYNTTNSGSVFLQWSKGLSLAKGEFVWIAESDDDAENTLLEKLYAALSTNAQAGLAFTDAWIINENNERIQKLSTYHSLKGFELEKSQTFHGRDFLKKGLSQWCTINNASAVLFRKTVLDSFAHELTNYQYAGDWATYIHIAKNHDLVYLHEPLSYFRQHSTNASNKAYTSGKMFIDEFRILSMLIKDSPSAQEEKQLIQRKYFVLVDMPLQYLTSSKVKQLWQTYSAIDKKLYQTLRKEKRIQYLKKIF